MDKNGADATSNTPEQFASLIQNEVGKYGSIIKKLGIKLD
jgi:tripartite-type tricarboxylate transporter receptor subunit TctC